MKDDLKRLLNEFLEETKKERTVKKSTQLTNDMPESFEYILEEPTLLDLIQWLNKD